MFTSFNGGWLVWRNYDPSKVKLKLGNKKNRENRGQIMFNCNTDACTKRHKKFQNVKLEMIGNRMEIKRIDFKEGFLLISKHFV